MTTVLINESAKRGVKSRSIIDAISLNLLMGANLITLVINLSISTSITGIIGLTFWLVLAGAMLIVGNSPHQQLNKLQNLILKYGFAPFLFLISFLVLWLEVLVTPGSAQFFNQAEQWMAGQFAGADAVIALIFNTLRGLLILYVGIALVKVINAAREDDDWKQMARTPLLILLSVTIGDTLVGFII